MNTAPFVPPRPQAESVEREKRVEVLLRRQFSKLWNKVRAFLDETNAQAAPTAGNDPEKSVPSEHRNQTHRGAGVEGAPGEVGRRGTFR